MKNSLLLIFLVSCFQLNAQVKTSKSEGSKSKSTTAKAPVSKPVKFKSVKDSFSYAVGVSIASNMKQQGIKDINTQLMTKAFDDVFADKTPALNQEQCNGVIQNKMMELQKVQQEEKERKGQVQKIKGEDFLKQNAGKPGIQTTASGLQYEILIPGTGDLHPNASDTVVVDYAGTLIDGSEFDNSYKRGEPAEFPLNQVIRGWTEILQLMTTGAKWKVYIPYNLAYGEEGREPTIPGYAPLIFEISLREIKPTAQK